MGIIELILFAVGLSMDAFAVSACIGLNLTSNKTEKTFDLKSALIVGLYFGFFQAAMPFIGYFVGIKFADKISQFDYLIAFLLLLFIGGKMIKESLSKNKNKNLNKDKDKDDDDNQNCDDINVLSIKKMLPLAVATSIDALAAGVSFALLAVNIFFAISLIGATTFALSVLGVKIGGIFGVKFKSKAELAGGIVLVLIGVKILLERLFIK